MDKLKDYFILLLSAGSGSRMGKLTKNTPKSILRVGNSTPLDFLLNQLKIRGLKEINIILGFQYKKILRTIEQHKDIKINYLIIKDIESHGSVWSLFKSFSLTKKKKFKSVLMFHTDLVFNEKFLDNIIKSKKKNIIGVKKSNKQRLKKKSFVVEVDKYMKIKKIGRLSEVKKPYGEIICVNKFSKETFEKLNFFLKNYFKKNSKNITWEYPMSDFAHTSNLHTLKNQNYEWININTKKDLHEANKLRVI